MDQSESSVANRASVSLTLSDLKQFEENLKLVRDALERFRLDLIEEEKVRAKGIQGHQGGWSPFDAEWDARSLNGPCEKLAGFAKYSDPELKYEAGALLFLMRNGPKQFFRGMYDRDGFLLSYEEGAIEEIIETLGFAIEEAIKTLEYDNLTVPGTGRVVNTSFENEVNCQLLQAAALDLETPDDYTEPYTEDSPIAISPECQGEVEVETPLDDAVSHVVAKSEMPTASTEPSKAEDGPTGVGNWRWGGEELPLDSGKRMTEKPWRLAKALFEAMPNRSLSLRDLAEPVNGDKEKPPTISAASSLKTRAMKWFRENGVSLNISQTGTDFTMRRVKSDS